MGITYGKTKSDFLKRKIMAYPDDLSALRGNQAMFEDFMQNTVGYVKHTFYRLREPEQAVWSIASDLLSRDEPIKLTGFFFNLVVCEVKELLKLQAEQVGLGYSCIRLEDISLKPEYACYQKYLVDSKRDRSDPSRLTDQIIVRQAVKEVLSMEPDLNCHIFRYRYKGQLKFSEIMNVINEMILEGVLSTDNTSEDASHESTSLLSTDAVERRYYRIVDKISEHLRRHKYKPS